jgi:hypothetical protein
MNVSTNTDSVRIVSEICGKQVAILHRITHIIPASVTRKEIAEFVTQEGAQTLQDPDDPKRLEWTIALKVDDEIHQVGEGLGYIQKTELQAEVANALNEFGVSVSDWPSYCL